MALGGGKFTTTNKGLPGAYINFVSAMRATGELQERGVAAFGLEMDWGLDGEIFVLKAEDFADKALSLFGYESGHEKLKGVRDVFCGAHTLVAGRLNTGVKAANELATAKYSGTRGNDILIAVRQNVENEQYFDVLTFLGTVEQDKQTVKNANELLGNSFVEWKPGLTLQPMAGVQLTGGTNGAVDGEAHKKLLDKLESYSFNSLGLVSNDETLKAVYKAYCERMRDEVGVKFKTVLYDYAADYEGCDNVKNMVEDAGWSEAALVYWATGISAGGSVSRSNQNKEYSGEFAVKAEYTQEQLRQALKSGQFVLHNVNGTLRVLDDINSLVTFTAEKGAEFAENQTIRIIDQLASEIAEVFANKYHGSVPNDEAGRMSLWSDIVKIHEALQNQRAITNFEDDDVEVKAGDTKKAVVARSKIETLSSMGALYVTVAVG